MEFVASWIKPKLEMGDICPIFRRQILIDKRVTKASLYITALGIYEAKLNGERISDYVLAPGWTEYQKRLQYQKYDITDMVMPENELTITVGKGWFRSPMPGWLESDDKKRRQEQPAGIIAEIHLEYEDGINEIIKTDECWEVAASAFQFSEIYDGESYDAGYQIKKWNPAHCFEWSKDILIPQEGEVIRQIGRVFAKEILITPANELVVDFGQEITGYVEFHVDAQAGDKIVIDHGEVLDKYGNFYNANYRSAKARIHYICRQGDQTWHPHHTFFGFRYIRLTEYPTEVKPEHFTAIVVCSELKKTGTIECGNNQINLLISNIDWAQKGNFLDVPTDCPQRDERLGWTGDAQVFIKAASYNYDVECFFTKWLRDLAAAQRANGAVGQVIPDYLPEEKESAAWGDAAVICPWQIYQTYGNRRILEEQFPSMKKWVDFITNTTTKDFLWIGGEHFGDWLGLDAPSGSYRGSSREDFIASAFYAYSTSILIKAGKIVGGNVDGYIKLYENIVDTFRKTFPVYHTQTEHILAAWFGLSEDVQSTVDDLAVMINNDGCQIKTGFVGTPYILHVLSKYGYSRLAYTLLLRKEYPSWLYSVEKGATTIWEHWDGIMENGDFWSTDMNSFNHYAYGAAVDWLYEQAAGITHDEENPGFSRVRIEPKTDERMGWLGVSINTRNGIVSSKWNYLNHGIRYDIKTEVPAVIAINNQETEVGPGEYIFWSSKLLMKFETLWQQKAEAF